MSRPTLRLLNARDGFAANSSSSHSLMLLRAGDELVGENQYTDFGWENFTLTDPKAKMNYFWGAVEADLSGRVGEPNARMILHKLGVEAPTEPVVVDHQSIPDLPYEWTGSTVSLEFLLAVKRLFERDDMAVLGGYDGADHPSYRPDQEVIWSPWLGISKTIARYDETARVWMLFNRETGMKARISLEGGELPQKGGVPELVDLKITNWCDMGCVACYQGSTAKGKHADVAYLDAVVEALAANQIPEVAIGGGEAVGHPYFSELVSALSERLIVPNLTTRKLGWLAENPETVSKLGAVAFSTEDPELVAKFGAATDGMRGLQRVVQVIDGMVSAGEFRAICEEAWQFGMRVTLLGYKTTGRGARWVPNLKNTEWVEAYHSNWFQHWKFSIDTALARNYLEALREMDAEEMTYHTEEGAWSAYIDAVDQRMGPSSYSDPEAMHELGRPSDLREVFAGVEVEDEDQPDAKTLRPVSVKISTR